MAVKKDTRLFAVAVLLVTTIWLLASQFTALENPISLAANRSGRKLTKLHLPALESIHAQAEFSSLYLRAQFSDFKPNVTERLDLSIPPVASLESIDIAALPREAPTKIRVPSFSRHVDASSLLFGVATTLYRLDESLDSFSHWASDTGAHIVAVISPRDETKGFTYESVGSRAGQMGIRLSIVELDKGFLERYISLIEVLHDFIEPATKWCGIVDDDTFFPSVARLLTVLGKYDTDQQYYVGGLTEDIKAVDEWGYQAFGGAGIFLTVPLVKQIRPKIEECYKLSILSGDGKLAICIYQFSTATLSTEAGLHQLDLMGDTTGFYEAARPLPVSLHHWKSWGHYDMVAINAISSVTGPESTFQKYLLADGFWMTHGFSIVMYSHDAAVGALSHVEGSMERTFDKVVDEGERTFLHSLAPLRPKDEGKVHYMMEASVKEDDDTMSLYYVRRQKGVGVGIIRVIWTAAR